MSKQFLLSLAEKVGFSAAYAGVTVAAAELDVVDYKYAPLLVSVLAIVKGLLAKRVGNPESAGLVD